MFFLLSFNISLFGSFGGFSFSIMFNAPICTFHKDDETRQMRTPFLELSNVTISWNREKDESTQDIKLKYIVVIKLYSVYTLLKCVPTSSKKNLNVDLSPIAQHYPSSLWPEHTGRNTASPTLLEDLCSICWWLSHGNIPTVHMQLLHMFVRRPPARHCAYPSCNHGPELHP